jgi:hypothetical protein
VTIKKERKSEGAKHTADATELFINDDLELGFGDAVWRIYVSSELCSTRTRLLTAIEQYALRKLVINFPVFFEHRLELIK